MLTLAQSIEPISGGAGWVGAGLLGLVLSWLLLKHLPDKDKQITALVEGKDKLVTSILTGKDAQVTALLAAKDGQLDAQRGEFTEAITSVVKAYRTELATDREACERRWVPIIDGQNKMMGRMTEGFRDLHLAVTDAHQAASFAKEIGHEQEGTAAG